MTTPLTQKQVNDIARELIYAHNQEYEFSSVYESEEAEDLPESDQIRILDAMYAAGMNIYFPEHGEDPEA